MKQRSAWFIVLFFIANLVQSSASAQYTYELRWGGLTALWNLIYPGDPEPVCFGSVKNIHVYLYVCNNGQCTKLSSIDCFSLVDPVEWDVSGNGQINHAGCTTKMSGAVLWPETGVYSIQGSMNYFGNTANTKNPQALSIAIWKPLSVETIPNITEPVIGTAGTQNQAQVKVNIEPSSVNFHGSAPITVISKGVNNSGGHVHDHNSTGAPAGSCTTVSGTSAGYATCTYTSSAFSQIEFLYATGCNITTSASWGSMIAVAIPNLVVVPTSSDYKLIGSTGTHPDNHYLTSGALSKLQTVIINYNQDPNTTNLICVNDCSLFWGGLFDYTASWNTPHSSHRLGTNTDIKTTNLTSYEKSILIDKINAVGNYLDEGDHHHVTF